MDMVVSIVAFVGVVLLFAVIGGIYFIYWFINSKNNMNGDTKTKPLDVFLYLGIAITLVTSVYNLLQILFTAINQKFADVLNPSYVDIYSSDMRLSVAFLVVMYPLYILLSWYLAKDISKFLYKRDLTIRKVMIHAIIFITLLSLIGTLISIIYTYLGGEITSRFMYKAEAIFVVSFSVFGYYYYSAKRDYSKKTLVPIGSTILASVVVVASLVWSIGIVGTPTEMRAKRLDSTRLSDLSSIQQQVFNRFQTTDKLPLTLGELNDVFQGYAVPVDPVTKEDYVYRVVQQPVVKINYATSKKEMTANAIFEICATFETMRDTNSPRGGSYPVKSGMLPIDISYSVSNYYYEGDVSPFWNHGVGETCFKRIITADMYYGK